MSTFRHCRSGQCRSHLLNTDRFSVASLTSPSHLNRLVLPDVGASLPELLRLDVSCRGMRNTSGFLNCVTEAERIVITLIPLDRFRLYTGGVISRVRTTIPWQRWMKFTCRRKKQQAPEVTLRISAVRNEKEWPAHGS
jgi:hypothetical protein